MMAAFTVRVICDGELVQDDLTFTDEQEHTAYARFDSTVSYYRRSDPLYPSAEVAIQLFDAAGDVLAEHLEVAV